MDKKGKEVSIYSMKETRAPGALQATNSVSAGFPSPADDYTEGPLDLNEHLVRHPAATFFVRVQGESMVNAGIHSGDLLIVDRALEPGHRKIVLAVLDGEFTVKRLIERGGRLYLYPENPAYKPVEITEENRFEVWGVVTAVIHEVL
ncbi:MAG TPA: translesion error-prone DNA polymerase V autoproteolytic subunit [Firmicutes bacterium]|nr:translesion error-prone DNA polymerase V autoproteolytic subunit [Bacillota bacterium]